MRKNFYIVLLILISSQLVKAQFCIHGNISSEDEKTNLTFAEVSLPSIGKFALTDSLGNFRMCNIPNGTYNLQVRFLGYRTIITSISTADSSSRIQLKMNIGHGEFPELVVYGHNESKPEETANTISSISTNDMRTMGALSLSDGIAKIPGVSQLTTGAGISKPVIRGLFGNRIQTVLLGLRFDNQQWQDEHGLGLTDGGVDRVEIIKGPASLLYGSEAMGGVINIIEEKPAGAGKLKADATTRFFSNTYGYTVDAGVKKSTEKLNWRLRLGTESHADYADGAGNRILNSRFGNYYAKATLGFNRSNWICRNDYMFSINNFGFLMDPVQLLDPPDARLSRSFDRPHHSVYLNILSSQNTFFLSKSKLKVNLGIQTNNRQEQEGGNKISLNMLLNTYSANGTWIKKISAASEISAGAGGFYQTNKNEGSRTIVPDANFIESSAFAYLKTLKKHFSLESGLRFDVKNIQTFATGSINTDPSSPGFNVTPFNKWYNALNGSAGISLFDGDHWNFKANVSSGYRPGNLSELSSNGLHEGTVRYEIGNTHLKIEQNFCADIFAAYENENLGINASAYANRFLNYIYLAPTNTEYIGFQIFRYIQQNALLKGMEATLDIHPEKLKRFDLRNTFSGVIGSTDTRENLPFIPAPKINSTLSVQITKPGSQKGRFNIRIGGDIILDQNRAGQFETSTAGYALLNTGAGFEKQLTKQNISISLSGNNLLNKNYYDHLSRFKYFGIHNIGRNISLNIKVNFK